MPRAENTHLLGKNSDYRTDPANPSTYGVKPYGPSIALAMGLNYVIGTGCFGLPYAFKEAGIFLSLSLMLVGVAGAVITMNYTLESLARAEGVCAATRGGGPLHQLTYRKFDFATIGEMFAGKFGTIAVQLVLILYGIGALWSYASVFASSMASLFYSYVMGDSCDVYGLSQSSGCMNAYYVFMAVFSVITISMVLLDISEQASIQKFLSIYRVVALVLMLVTMIIKIAVDGFDVLEARYNHVGAFNWSNFGKGFGPTLLALNCQYNMPDVLQPLNPKSSARRVAIGALLTAGSFYLLVGLLGALSFDEINPLASLMWSNYTGCGNGWGDCGGSTNVWGIIVQLVILIFPVVNVTSTYPMVGVTVGDNMLMSMPKSVTAPFGIAFARSGCRLLAAVPPLVLAMVFKKLDLIFAISGLFGFLLGLSIPCWFQVVGSRYCQRVWGFSGASITPFTQTWISSIPFASTYLVITFGILGVAIATLNG
ncbi:hypothetical protein Poli38472_009646 [Pythium oligandrum]|uniref:Amino acid transporter transmembrane domain-containing protein n=1 Tax=Pythium oligandrum TaxID=41045 RepID=A0A8K1CGM0_PYTOL|nr:hypothetical protein Poli38472_009646 [Pythium oligandrum]|eukprot:TMW62153.1 hypothetical protein Poli38472_009646 [Pythium oligandrum]